MPYIPEQSWSENLATENPQTDIPPNWQAISADPFRQKQLKAALQEHVTKTVASGQPGLTALNAQLVTQILTSHELTKAAIDPLLEQLFCAQLAIYQQADISPDFRKRQFIHQSGLVLSPDYCVNTLKDTLRVGQFIKAIHAAITTRLKDQNSIHIAYPACGPFAPLLVPLLSYYQQQAIYSSAQIRVTLIDIQPGAVQALAALIKAHNISNFIERLSREDAVHFNTDDLFDIVIIEAMQHGFSREAHLRIAEHCAKLLKNDGQLIPEKIIIEAWLTHAQAEYVEQWEGGDARPENTLARTFLGEVLCIDRDLAEHMTPSIVDSHTQLLPCNRLRVPDFHCEHPQTLILSSRMHLADDFWLNEYESGITHPLPDLNICVNFIPKVAEPGDVLVNSGDYLKFYYCLNGLPGFFATKDATASTQDISYA